MAGREQKAREGKWIGGFAPYGYMLVDGRLLINGEEAEIIRIIYDKYIHSNGGAGAVAEYLNTHGCKKAKSEGSRVPQCPPEKEKAIEEALRHFRMIP